MPFLGDPANAVKRSFGSEAWGALEKPESLDFCQREKHTGNGTRMREIAWSLRRY